MVTWIQNCFHPLKQAFFYLFIDERSKLALHSQKSLKVRLGTAALPQISAQESRDFQNFLSAGCRLPFFLYLKNNSLHCQSIKRAGS